MRNKNIQKYTKIKTYRNKYIQLKDIKCVTVISNNWPKDLLGANVYTTIKLCR